MIWVNFVKRFLGHVSLCEWDSLVSFLASDVTLENGGATYTGIKSVAGFYRGARIDNIRILHTAYNNKSIYIVYRFTKDSRERECVTNMTIENNKIKSIVNYYKE